MIKPLHILLTIALAAMLHGCAQHDFDEFADVNADERVLLLRIGIDEMVGDISSNQSRAVEYDVNTTFENGDEIGLIVFENNKYHGNYKYVYTDGTWKTSGDVYLLPKETKTNKYIVYSPYNANVTAATASVEGLKTLIKPVADQSTKEKYHACDLMTATVNSQANTIRTVDVTLNHEYSAFLIDSRSTIFITKVGRRQVSWSSQIVKKTGSSTYQDDAEDAAVRVVSDGKTVDYIPWLNNASGEGDYFYRFVLPPTATYDNRAHFSWSQKYISVYKDFAPETPLEKGWLYKCSEFVEVDENTTEIKVGDIFCNDETDHTGVVLPLEMFRNAKYTGRTSAEDTKLKPIGIVFQVGTSAADNEAGYERGYAISLKNAGKYSWGHSNNSKNDITDIKNITLLDAGVTLTKEQMLSCNYIAAHDVQQWTKEDFDGRHNCEVICGQSELTGATVTTAMGKDIPSAMKTYYPAFYYSLMFGTTTTSTSDYAPPTNSATPCSGWYFGGAAEMKFYYNNLGKLVDNEIQADGYENLRYIYDSGYYGWGTYLNLNESVYWANAGVVKIQEAMNGHQAIIDAYMDRPTGENDSWCQAFSYDDDFITSSECQTTAATQTVIGIGFLNRLNSWPFSAQGQIAIYGRDIVDKTQAWYVRPIIAF